VFGSWPRWRSHFRTAPKRGRRSDGGSVSGERTQQKHAVESAGFWNLAFQDSTGRWPEPSTQREFNLHLLFKGYYKRPVMPLSERWVLSAWWSDLHIKTNVLSQDPAWCDGCILPRHPTACRICSGQQPKWPVHVFGLGRCEYNSSSQLSTVIFWLQQSLGAVITDVRTMRLFPLQRCWVCRVAKVSGGSSAMQWEVSINIQSRDSKTHVKLLPYVT